MQANTLLTGYSTLFLALKYAFSMKAVKLLFGSMVCSALYAVVMLLGIDLIFLSNAAIIRMLLLSIPLFSLIVITIGYLSACSVVMHRVDNQVEPSYLGAIGSALCILPYVLGTQIIHALIWGGFIVISLLFSLFGKLPFIGQLLNIVLYPLLAIGFIVIFLSVTLTIQGMSIPLFLTGQSLLSAIAGCSSNRSLFQDFLALLIDMVAFKFFLLLFSIFFALPILLLGIGYSTLVAVILDPFALRYLTDSQGVLIGLSLLIALYFTLLLLIDFAGRALMCMRLQHSSNNAS